MASNSGRSVVTVQSASSCARDTDTSPFFTTTDQCAVLVPSLMSKLNTPVALRSIGSCFFLPSSSKNSPVGSVIVSLSVCSAGAELAGAPLARVNRKQLREARRTHTGGRRRRGRSLRPPPARTNRLGWNRRRRRSAWRPLWTTTARCACCRSPDGRARSRRPRRTRLGAQIHPVNDRAEAAVRHRPMGMIGRRGSTSRGPAPVAGKRPALADEPTLPSEHAQCALHRDGL